jgi:hypothetical protein
MGWPGCEFMFALVDGKVHFKPCAGNPDAVPNADTGALGFATQASPPDECLHSLLVWARRLDRLANCPPPTANRQPPVRTRPPVHPPAPPVHDRRQPANPI